MAASSQAGSPLELYEHPANRFVASFIGSPTINLVPAVTQACSSSGARLEVHAGCVVDVPVDGSSLAAGQRVEIGIRPEHLRVASGDAPASGIRFGGEVTLIEQLGESHLLYLRCADGLELVARAPGHTRLRVGDRIALEAEPAGLHVFAADGRACRRLAAGD